MDAAKKAGRNELEAQSQKQLELVNTYLPAEMGDDELKGEVKRIIAANKDVYEKNPKAIIGILMKELKSKAESSRILQILNTLQKV
ncbi:GatB/YqeY domain-containing protein [Candidatus Microgenomates bacterium]|nr:GatB/YqeY domain-containing protein [Candidatus Microgenomates bacterium]